MKNKIGVTEILGILGLSIWIVVILLRYTEIGSSNIFLFIRGVLPNFAAAWFMTMVFKIVLIKGFDVNYSYKIHILNSIFIFVIAMASEVFFWKVYNRGFDMADLTMTVIAQTIMIGLPYFVKKKFAI